jgi:hypothetical protein
LRLIQLRFCRRNDFTATAVSGSGCISICRSGAPKGCATREEARRLAGGFSSNLAITSATDFGCSGDAVGTADPVREISFGFFPVDSSVDAWAIFRSAGASLSRENGAAGGGATGVILGVDFADSGAGSSTGLDSPPDFRLLAYLLPSSDFSVSGCFFAGFEDDVGSLPARLVPPDTAAGVDSFAAPPSGGDSTSLIGARGVVARVKGLGASGEASGVGVEAGLPLSNFFLSSSSR